MAFKTFLKDPDATLDYTVDWSSWLDSADTLSSSSWILDSGLTEVSSSNTTTEATIYVSGGEAGESYNVTNRIITIGGRTDDRTITLKVVQK